VGWAVARSTSGASLGMLARPVPGVASLLAFSITFVLASRVLGSPELAEISSALGRTLTKRSRRV
jgi:hypothetical protein